MPAYRKLEDRFWEKVDKKGDDDCWLWMGAKIKSTGYGRIRMPRQRLTEGAHRVSYMIHFGDIPDGKIVCHRCGNPTCVNPSHLYAGSFSENNMDRIRHGRQSGGANPGEKHHAAKLNRQDVDSIRELRRSGFKLADLARNFGVSQSQVFRIIRGESWRT